MHHRQSVTPARFAFAALVALALAGCGPRQPEPRTAPATAAAAHPADFRGESPSPDARTVADWVASTHDNREHAFILVDKKDARVYVFTPDGHLQDSAPALLGAARGDDLVPGSGSETLAQMTPGERRTPAGRFVAQAGTNADDEDVIWVDYDDAISMHRVRPKVAAERRLERLASLATDDNRISYGCINLPVAFYEDVARPAVARYGAIVYVLPEVKTVQQAFGIPEAAQG